MAQRNSTGRFTDLTSCAIEIRAASTAYSRPDKDIRKTLLFMEPHSFMAGRGKDLFSDRKGGDGILALMEPNEKLVDHFLKENPHVKRIDFVAPKGRPLLQAELDFFGVLMKKLEPFQIEVGSVSHDRTVEHEGAGLSL